METTVSWVIDPAGRTKVRINIVIERGPEESYLNPQQKAEMELISSSLATLIQIDPGLVKLVSSQLGEMVCQAKLGVQPLSMELPRTLLAC